MDALLQAVSSANRGHLANLLGGAMMLGIVAFFWGGPIAGAIGVIAVPLLDFIWKKLWPNTDGGE